MILSTFWEGPPIPGYLALCISTWKQQVPGLEWRNVNWSNWHELLEDEVPIETLKRASFPQQADVVKAFALLKWKGIAIDVDTIVCPLPQDAPGSFFKREPEDNRLKIFGVVPSGGLHIACMSVGEHINPVICEQGRRVRNILVNESHRFNEWNVLGPMHLENMRKEDAFKDSYDVLTRDGAILEDTYCRGTGLSGSAAYREFYFGRQFSNLDPETTLAKAPYGLVMLHNSWTPSDFASLTVDEVLETDTLMGKILKRYGDVEIARDIERRGLRDGYIFP